MVTTHQPREADAARVDDAFLERWSPRSFLSDPIPEDDLKAIFEAARWAPSSRNSQPWTFVYATDGPARDALNEAVKEGNRRWTDRAPLLAFLVLQRRDERGEIRNAMVDGGLAAMSLIMQAESLGYRVHLLGGILPEEAHRLLGFSEEDYRIPVGLVIGRQGDGSELPEDLAAREFPKGRKPLDEVAVRAEELMSRAEGPSER